MQTAKGEVDAEGADAGAEGATRPAMGRGRQSGSAGAEVDAWGWGDECDGGVFVIYISM